MATSADYPPWESVDPAGHLVGFEIDIGNEICKRIEARCEWANQAFDGLLPGLLVGQFDMVLADINITEQRAASVLFTDAYVEQTNSFFALGDSALSKARTVADLKADLRDKVAGVQTGTIHEVVIKKNFPTTRVRIYDRPDELVQDIQSGRIDAGLMELTSAVPYVNSATGERLALVGPKLTSADFPQFGSGVAVALSKSEDALRVKANAAIKAMLADGTVARLSQTWFNEDISVKEHASGEPQHVP